MKLLSLHLNTALLCLMLSACQPAQSPSSVTAPEQTESTASAGVWPGPKLTPGWWHDAVVYQIWPRSFADSDADGHGDFAGMQARLPYLTQLGVDAIWLTPIFAAPSYHGYDFTEFYQVEDDYGTMADFESLVAAAAAKEIKIILDLVINHISDQHPWFVRSAQGEAPYRDYFIWRDDLPTSGWGPAWDSQTIDPKVVWHYHPVRKQYYYAAFGASQPDLNLRHPAVIAEMKKMAKFWLDKGVAGFRLDAVRYAVENGPGQQADTAETMAYWQDFSQYVRSIQPNALLVGEAWADLPIAAAYHVGGQGLDAGFDFEFGYEVLALLQGEGAVKAEFGTMQANRADSNAVHPLQLNFQQRQATQVPLAYFSPFITNHDQPRVGWQLQGDQAKAKLAAAMLFASPGPTYVYYGEEIGMSQASDLEHIQRRAPMLWDNSHQAGFTTAANSWVESMALFPPQQSADWWAPFMTKQLQAGVSVTAQQQDPHSLWSLYQRLIQLKKQRPELGVAGSYFATQLADSPLVLITRELSGQRTEFLLNVSAEPQPIPADWSTRLPHSVWQGDISATDSLAAWQLAIRHN